MGAGDGHWLGEFTRRWMPGRGRAKPKDLYHRPIRLEKMEDRAAPGTMLPLLTSPAWVEPIDTSVATEEDPFADPHETRTSSEWEQFEMGALSDDPLLESNTEIASGGGGGSSDLAPDLLATTEEDTINSGAESSVLDMLDWAAPLLASQLISGDTREEIEVESETSGSAEGGTSGPTVTAEDGASSSASPTASTSSTPEGGGHRLRPLLILWRVTLLIPVPAIPHLPHRAAASQPVMFNRLSVTSQMGRWQRRTTSLASSVMARA